MAKRLLMIAMILLVAYGCTPSRQNSGPDVSSDQPSADLNQWIYGHLVPTLLKTITGDPNLRNRPFSIVGWDVETNSIATQVDELTLSVREMLSTELLKARGVQYIPLSAPRPHAAWHQNRLIDVNCSDYGDIEWYVLLTVRISPLTDKALLRVQAGEMRDGNIFLLPGFSEHFEMTPSGRISQLIAAKKTAEYLRGLRYLPFEEDQKDLLASYLAHRVSCIFKNMSHGGDLSVYMVGPERVRGTFMAGTIHMIENYLDKFHEIQIVGKQDVANATMECMAIQVHSDLWQVWIKVQEQSSRRVGASTEAYIKKKP